MLFLLNMEVLSKIYKYIYIYMIYKSHIYVPGVSSSSLSTFWCITCWLNHRLRMLLLEEVTSLRLQGVSWLKEVLALLTGTLMTTENLGMSELKDHWVWKERYTPED